MARTVGVMFGLSILFTIIAKWRIETMVLPELSRTMAYTTRNTVNRIHRKKKDGGCTFSTIPCEPNQETMI